MSFVFTMPDLIEAAAGDLAGIGSTLRGATAAAASPTTGVATAAGDEVSAAIAAVFGSHGQEFQVLNAEAAAFHDEFVQLLNSGAAAYLSTEVANAASSLADIAGPYQQLFANTGANLEALGGAISANPAPLLKQFIANQEVYGQTIVAAIEGAIQNFPAGVPVAIQTALQNLAKFDPGAFLQWFISNQIGYAQTIGPALHNAAVDFGTGLQALPASFQSAFQALLAGDVSGAVSDIGQGFLNLFFTGIDVQTIGGNGVNRFIVSLTPTGSLGDLLPILTVPGEVAQNFSYILPPGSVLQQMSQNLTNVINTVTDTSVISHASIVVHVIPFPPSVTPVLSVTNFYGMPMALLLDAVGAPVNALTALGTSTTAFVGAVQTGNFAGAVGTLIDAPAVVANGFLNGQETLPLAFDLSGNPGVINLPLDGLLVPVTPYTASLTATIPPFGTFYMTSQVAGTPLSGLVPALLTYVPAELAEAIGKS